MEQDSKEIDFQPLDKLTLDAIERKVFPSAVVLLANDKKVIYQKAFGTFTYNSTEKVDLDTIYDCASITKILAGTPVLMKLYEEGKYQLSDPIIKYIPEMNNNGKEDITILNLMIHNSGLQACAEFHKFVKDKSEILEYIFNSKKDYETGTKTVYSDFGFILLGILAERLTNKKMDQLAKEILFDPLGLDSSTYLPNESLWPKIAPTEDDQLWRKRLVRGTVHDQTCDILGEVTAHAGIFSNIKDLHKYMNMLLHYGSYIDSQGQTKQLFKKETVELFTKCWKEGINYDNTRALGFETKPKPTGWGPACGTKFSENCFGHTGFTGTSAWVDREKKLIVVVLTNWVYPDMTLPKKPLLDFRTEVHDLICTCLGY